MKKERESFIHSNYDVVILGGGLSGLTLGLQLINEDKSISVLIIEKRKVDAPIAGHKVGESVVELGAHYLRNVLNLKSYLQEKHLAKYGFRYFLDATDKNHIQSRIEAGSTTSRQVASNHIDRGVFENDLTELIKEKGVTFLNGAAVIDATVSVNGHSTSIEIEDRTIEVKSRWLIDASGRRSILKRKLNLHKELTHNINSVWFRLNKKIDVNNWSSDAHWKSQLPPDFRRLSTIHFMGEGYWLWIIPLPNDNTSVGIVASEEFHSFTEINSFEKAIDWIQVNEPLVAEKIESTAEDLIDFKVLKHYAHDSLRFISPDRWCITGEAGVFLDPFYSPGTDFIALSNSWITDLIIRDTAGEDITTRANLYEHTQRQLVDGWFTLYKDLYSYLSGSRVFLSKIVWDWSTYWGILAPMYIQGGFTDMEVMRSYASNQHRLGQRFNALNENVQKLLKDWSTFDKELLPARYFNVFEIQYLYKIHLELEESLDGNALIERIHKNLDLLENVAAELFRIAISIKEHQEFLGSIDPYTADLTNPDSWSKGNVLPINALIREDLELIWQSEPQTENEASAPLQNQKKVQHIFINARNLVHEHENMSQLLTALDTVSDEFQSVAYEGASFELGIQAIEQHDLTAWFDFLESSSAQHEHHICIGFGWSFGATNSNPLDFKDVNNNHYLLPMIFDGMGYYFALYKGRKTLVDCEIPEIVHDAFMDSFDFGVGRRIWYQAAGIPEKVIQIIEKFPDSRKQNIWKGIGMACGYVGGTAINTLIYLKHKADIYQEYFSIGFVTSAAYNLIHHRNEKLTLKSCQLIADLNTEKLNELVQLIQKQKKINTKDILNTIELNIFNPTPQL